MTEPNENVNKTPDLEEMRVTIRNIIKENLKITDDSLDYNTKLREIKNIESVMILKMLLQIEQSYGVEMDNAFIFNIETINDIANAVYEARKLNDQNS